VYAESSPGVYDMRAVKLGPPAGDVAKAGQVTDEFYPVVEGLEEGERVVTVGTFLVDAENRLHPSPAAGKSAAASGTAEPEAHQDGHDHGGGK
jgi:hypothetical protein